jgi:hypothetical protein
VIVASLDAPLDDGLEEALGHAGAVELREAMAVRARRWAATVAPDVAFEATTMGAAAAALHEHRGPVLLAAGDVPGLDAEVAAMALGDLRAGCDVVLGAAHDARPYLVGLPRVDEELMELAARRFEGGLLGAMAERALTLGMLRAERRLVSAADARALALDPVAPPDLRALAGAVCARARAGTVQGMEFEREEEQAAAEEAGAIGGETTEHAPGETGDPTAYNELDGRPAGQSAESWRPVEEAGGGEAEGFETAEAELIERAENAHGPSPIANARGGVDEEAAALDVEYGEADAERTSEDEAGTTDR